MHRDRHHRPPKPGASAPAVSSETPTPPTPPDDDPFVRTKILLLGVRRAGKSSIQQVLFNNLNPKQAFFVEPTTELTKHKVDSFIPLEIWDCPGAIPIDRIDAPLSAFTTIIFVIDIKDSYDTPIKHLIKYFIAAYQLNPQVNLEVFVHKGDAYSEDIRNESLRFVQKRIEDELSDLSPLLVSVASPLPTSPTAQVEIEAINLPISYYLTSVLDHTLHDTFARVFTRILAPGCLPYLEQLLNAFSDTSNSTKAFLFDMKAKFYVATDNAPVDTVTHNLCCDYVHMLNEFSGLYKSASASPTLHPRRTGVSEESPNNFSAESSAIASTISSPLLSTNSAGHPITNGHSSRSPQSLSAAVSGSTTPTHTVSVPTPSATPNQATGASGSANSNKTRSNSTPSTSSGPVPKVDTLANPTPTKPKKQMFYPSSSTSLMPDTTLMYQQINPRLALLALFPTTVWETKRGLVEYNVVFLREGVQEVYEVERDSRLRRTEPQTLETSKQPRSKSGMKVSPELSQEASAQETTLASKGPGSKFLPDFSQAYRFFNFFSWGDRVTSGD